MSRRRFLRPTEQHPTQSSLPWLIDSKLDHSECETCQLCPSTCPTQIISIDHKNQPYLDFSAGGCELCGKCVEVCPQDTFNKRSERAWVHRLKNSASCMAYQAVYCRSCQDACPSKAIRFDLSTITSGLPEILQEQCTGCGFCISACPSDSLSLF